MRGASSAKHTCTLRREREVLREGLSISLDVSYDQDPDLPDYAASFLTQQYPTDLEVGDQLQMLLDDGRSGDVIVSRIPKIAEGLYMVGFRFLSGLQ